MRVQCFNRLSTLIELKKIITVKLDICMRLMYARDYKLFAIASIALNIQNNPYITLNVLSASYLDFGINMNRLLCDIYLVFSTSWKERSDQTGSRIN